MGETIIAKRTSNPLAHLRIELFVEVELVADDDRRYQQGLDFTTILVSEELAGDGIDMLPLRLWFKLLQKFVGLVFDGVQPLAQ